MGKVSWDKGQAPLEVDESTSLLEALRSKGLYIKSSCGGHASCSDCIIRVTEGEDNLNSPPFEEVRLLGNVFHITKERLACQTFVSGDVTIDLSGHDQGADEERLRQKTGQQFKSKRSGSLKVNKKDEDKFSSRGKFDPRKGPKLPEEDVGGRRDRRVKGGLNRPKRK